MKAKIVQGEPEIPAEIIAQSIVEISAGVKKMRGGRLGDRAIILLIHHSSGVAQREIKLVLDAMSMLENTYLRKKP